MCTVVCPHAVLLLGGRKARVADRNACIECGACARNCPAGALTVKAGVGCASAIIHSWLTGEEPSCDCGGSC
jgi:NAD-dependent dihydropyrimidine dehydrogenase PreA subunit